jgi:hypothetical protein
MARENINITKDGIAAPLITFLSAHAASIIVVAFLTIAYYFPVFKLPLSSYKHFSLSTTNKIFVGLLILALLHPFGIFLDLVGWIFLGWMEKPLETLHFRRKTFLTKGTRDYLGFETLKKEYSLTADSYYGTAREKEYLIYSRYPELVAELDFPLGASILLRNLTVSSFLVAVIFLFMCQHREVLISVSIALMLIALNSCISFFHSLSVLRIFHGIERSGEAARNVGFAKGVNSGYEL